MIQDMMLPIRHVRQAAGRYMTFPLVQCKFVDNALKESENYEKQNIFIMKGKTMSSSSIRLDRKKILVTGVSRPLGIGATLAKRFAEAGATVAVHGEYSVPL